MMNHIYIYYVYIMSLWIQTLCEKVLNSPNYSKIYPKHFLSEGTWIHRVYILCIYYVYIMYTRYLYIYNHQILFIHILLSDSPDIS